MKKILLGFIAIGLLTFVGCVNEGEGLTGEWASEMNGNEWILSITEESITCKYTLESSYYGLAYDYDWTQNKISTYDVLYITDDEIKIRISDYDSKVISYVLGGDGLFFIGNGIDTYDIGISPLLYTRK